MEQIIVTSKGKKKLEDELEYLKSVKRKDVVEAIKIARDFGDLSENSEYDEAKTEQGKTESRILELEEMLKNVKVVDDIAVKVLDMDYNEEIEYILVGSTEANPMENKISDLSPIGKAISEAKVGDTVTYETPGGEAHLKILAIEKQK